MDYDHEHIPVRGSEKFMVTLCLICLEKIVPTPKGWVLFVAQPTEIVEEG